ncbi:MAG: MFS transporter [Clostridia bacterium]|nr:MFS transporter [Clostridia bacterium]
MTGLNEANVRRRPSVKGSHKLAMGVGDFGYSLISCTVATYIMAFGTMAVGVSGTLMGIAIAIGTIFDAVSDPIVGYLSDNTKNKFFGKRFGFMLFGLIGLIVCSIFIWAIPTDMAPMGQFLWFAIGLTLIRTFNTLYFTPVGALSVEISDDYNERTTIQAVRSIFYIIGMILPIVIIGIFQNKYTVYDDAGNVLVPGQFSVKGYIDFSYVAAAVAIVTSVYLFVMTFSNVPRLNARYMNETEEKSKKSLKQVLFDFFSVLKNKDMRQIIFGYSTAMMSATLIITLGFHVFTFTFQTTTTQMYTLMGGLLVMTIIGQPVWMILSKKTDKKKTMLIGLIVSLCGCMLLFIAFLMRGSINKLIQSSFFGAFVLLPPLMIAGMGTGVLYSMPLAIIGDVVAKNSRTQKGEKMGTYAGMMTLAYKVSQALTQLTAGVALDLIGFQEGSTIQTESVSASLGWFLCIGIMLAVSVGILILSKLDVDKEEITRILEEQRNA